MNYPLKFLFVVVIFSFNNWVYADQRWFQVELIVFRQQAPNSEIFEQTELEIELVERYARASGGKKTLQYVYNRLSKSSNYQPFYYQSWRIPVSNGSISLPIDVSGIDENLTGWIKIQRGHLLHVLADLEFSPPALGTERLVYRLTEKRRVLLNEVHYLDHPMFGAVLKLSPVE